MQVIFAYEARSIHYDKRKRIKVFLERHPKRYNKLKRRIETQSIPWFDDKIN